MDLENFMDTERHRGASKRKNYKKYQISNNEEI